MDVTGVLNAGTESSREHTSRQAMLGLKAMTNARELQTRSCDNIGAYYHSFCYHHLHYYRFLIHPPHICCTPHLFVLEHKLHQHCTIKDGPINADRVEISMRMVGEIGVKVVRIHRQYGIKASNVMRELSIYVHETGERVGWYEVSVSVCYAFES